MSRRRRSREAALQVLFAMSFTAQDRHEASAHVQGIESRDVQRLDEFSALLLELVERHAAKIDAALAAALRNWSADRLAAADRAILRLATAEILLCEDIPPRVTINEYIELARRFGGEDSPKFVNGVLDAVLKKSKRNSKDERVKDEG